MSTLTQEWAVDFASDVTASGRRLRIFSVVDGYTQELLGPGSRYFATKPPCNPGRFNKSSTNAVCRLRFGVTTARAVFTALFDMVHRAQDRCRAHSTRQTHAERQGGKLPRPSSRRSARTSAGPGMCSTLEETSGPGAQTTTRSAPSLRAEISHAGRVRASIEAVVNSAMTPDGNRGHFKSTLPLFAFAFALFSSGVFWPIDIGVSLAHKKHSKYY
jgi:hypothetical protein